MLCRTVAVAVTRSWLQRLCGICPRAWLKDATPSSEPSSWCCRAWMNLAENRVFIYIYIIYIYCVYIYILYIYIIIYILCIYILYIYNYIYMNYFMCKSGFPSQEKSTAGWLRVSGAWSKIYEKKTTRLRWLEDSLHRELHHLLEGSKRDSPEMGISSQSICRLVWNPCARW